MKIQTWKRHIIIYTILLMLSPALISCSTPEEKKIEFYDKGIALYEKGDFTRALLEFKNAIQVAPEFIDAYYMAGMTSLEEKEYAGAYKYFLTAASRDPQHYRSQLQLGWMFLEAKMLDQAGEKADVLLAHDPTDNDAHILCSGILLAEEKTEEAGHLLESLEFTGAPPQKYFITLHNVLDRSGTPEKKERLLNKALATYPDNIKFLALLVHHYTGEKRYDEAIGTMKKIIALEPDNFINKKTLAAVMWQSGDKKGVEDYFAGLTGEEPENEELWTKIIRFYAEKRDFELVEKALKKALAANPQSFKLNFEKTNFLLARKRTDEAIELLQNCLGLDRDPASPGILDSHLALAAIYLDQGQHDKADSHVQAVIRENQNSLEANFIKGKINLINGDAEAAVANFNLVVSENPDRVEAALLLARALVADRQPALAVDSLKRAHKKMPENPDLLLALARITADREDISEAEGYLLQLVEIDPENQAFKLKLADFYLAAEKFSRAEAIYLKIRNKTPQEPALWLRLAELYGKWRKPEMILPLAEQGYKDNQDESFFFEFLGKTLIDAGKYDRATDLCRERLQAENNDPAAYNLLGEIYTTQKKFSRAETNFRKSAGLAPDWQVPAGNLATLFLLQGKKDQAVRGYEDIIKADPENTTAYGMLGTIYLKSGETEKARGIYEKAVEKIPDDFNFNNNLAFVLSEYYQDNADHSLALRYAERAHRIAPQNSTGLDTLGWAHYRLKNFDQARTYLDQALESDPERPEYNYHLGMTLYSSGEPAAAREKLQTAVNSKRNFTGKDEAQKILDEIS